MSLRLSPGNTLPTDGLAGTLVGRAWVPGPLAGPSPVVLREDGVFDVSARFATLSALFEEEAPLHDLRDYPRALPRQPGAGPSGRTRPHRHPS